MSKSVGQGDQFYQLEKSLSRNLKIEGEYETAEERAMIQLKKSQATLAHIAIFAAAAVVFVLIFLPLMALIQYHDVVQVWDKYGPKDGIAPSGVKLAIALKFPFTAGWFFPKNAGMATAMYICVRFEPYKSKFLKDAATTAKYTQSMWSSALWGQHASSVSDANYESALDVICNGWGTEAGLDSCLPACPPGQGDSASDFVSSGVSTGLTGLMVGASVGSLPGAIIGFVVGAAGGAITQGVSSSSSNCKS